MTALAKFRNQRLKAPHGASLRTWLALFGIFGTNFGCAKSAIYRKLAKIAFSPPASGKPLPTSFEPRGTPIQGFPQAGFFEAQLATNFPPQGALGAAKQQVIFATSQEASEVEAMLKGLPSTFIPMTKWILKRIENMA